MNVPITSPFDPPAMPPSGGSGPTTRQPSDRRHGPASVDPEASGHRDYDGRSLRIQPLDHLPGADDCRRFTVR
ncbi:MAG: hypothetical protein KGN77_06395 [Xanthomonadaceae bacterium]|nr:hypothetical protein [Xanthomonadaceae bacterium]MDE1962650.1 hypothetical protein [Xanthomonadaceae bacterium]